MKIAIVTLIALSAQLSSAACLGEAQFIAKVESVSYKADETCVVMIASSSIERYNESMVCPLDLSEVLNAGVEVTSQNGHMCSYSAGQDISGVLVKDASGRITLEQ